MTNEQLAKIEALARASTQDRHLTPAQRHDIHKLMAEIAGTPEPTCCR